MRFTFFTALTIFLAATACGPAPTSTDATTEAATADTVTTSTAAEGENQEMTKRGVTEAAPVEELDPNFPASAKVDFNQVNLQPLCANKYGCLQEGFYPLGWSADGKFAFLLENTNEAVQNTTVHLVIQDMESDEEVLRQTFKASEQAGYSEETDDYTAAGIWRANEADYRKLLAEHQIQLGQGITLLLPENLNADHGIQIKTEDEKKKNVLFDIMMVDTHQLYASKEGRSQKRVARQQMGKYDMVLQTKPLGYFQSPFEGRIAILDAMEKRGYEGPPNVLKLQLVGCDLDNGF